MDRASATEPARGPVVVVPVPSTDTGSQRLLDPKALKRLDDYREPRLRFEDLFEPVD